MVTDRVGYLGRIPSVFFCRALTRQTAQCLRQHRAGLSAIAGLSYREVFSASHLKCNVVYGMYFLLRCSHVSQCRRQSLCL